MLGYDYDIIYKNGQDNVVVDFLSTQYEEDGSLLALSLPSSRWLKEACRGWLANSTLRKII